ncbi:putative peroxiredoxin bcp [Alicyclobacillus cellulosilyticus]|uniref:thioredoxin-dependent peroxiredoxin n=1 Tax=Alicyclobacillus cellulosilyticus TaxID=1003997 RepID=A0A917NFY2_9BACL|nr:peroxiredoxin [Alicyclobacillus cellulosilyticus]GGI97593.1 putative peroxiredoxin bcp [Alicyclobacillus cellulosilyticus]
MGALTVGQPAPDFTLPAHDGTTVSLHDQRGHVVVLFFYPKDDTPGCTRENCAFRDLYPEFERLGARVFGVSRDSLSSHQKFAAKYGLKAPLLSDEDGSVCAAYGVLKEKNMYGKTSVGIERTTVVIDAEGRVAQVWPKVKVDGHAEAVLAFVRSLTQGGV